MSAQYLRILAHHSLPRAAPTLRLVSATRPSRFYQLKAHSPNQTPFYQRSSFSSSAMTLQPRHGTTTFKTTPKVCASEMTDKIHELMNGNSARALCVISNQLHLDWFTEAVAISKESKNYNKLKTLVRGSLFPCEGRIFGAISAFYVDVYGHSYRMDLTEYRTGPTHSRKDQRRSIQHLHAGHGKLCIHGFVSSDGLSAVSGLCQNILPLLSAHARTIAPELANLSTKNRLATVYLQHNRNPVLEYDSAPNGPSDGPNDGFGSGGMPPYGGMPPFGGAPPAGGVPPMPQSLWPPIGGPEAIDRHL
ncbi:hypothetical protein CF336_g2899 [Tilletia laevis]|nr:hypothetical protein CF336_g2899 [Tilletia laevis]